MDMMLEQFKTIFDRPEKVKHIREVIIESAVNGKISVNNFQKNFCICDGMEYEIPSLWKVVKLGDVLSYKQGLQVGKNSQSSIYKEGTVRYLRIIDFRHDDDIKYINKPSTDVFCKKDDLIMIRYGGTAGEIVSGKEGVFHNNMFRIDFDKNVINEKYLRYYLSRGTLRNELFGKSRSSTMPQVSHKVMNSIILILPPLEEQKRIVEKVDSLMLFCDKLEKALEKKVHYGELAAKSVFNAVGNVSTVEELEETLRFILLNFKDLALGDNALKELKNCIFQLAVQGKLVKQDPKDKPVEVLLDKIREEKEKLIKEKKIKKEKPSLEISNTPYIIPSRWYLVRLGNLAKVIEYGTSTKADLDQSKVPVLRMNNIIDGRIDYKNLKYVDSNIKDLPRLYLNNKDLLFNRTNSYELVGKTAVYRGLDNTMTFASYLIRVELFNKMVNADYINIVMNSNLYRVTQIEPEITQQNGQANFNGTKLKSTIIPLPPLEEQKRIVEKVNSLMVLYDKLEKKIEKSKDYSNRLMESILKSSF